MAALAVGPAVVRPQWLFHTLARPSDRHMQRLGRVLQPPLALTTYPNLLSVSRRHIRLGQSWAPRWFTRQA